MSEGRSGDGYNQGTLYTCVTFQFNGNTPDEPHHTAGIRPPEQPADGSYRRDSVVGKVVLGKGPREVNHNDVSSNRQRLLITSLDSLE